MAERNAARTIAAAEEMTADDRPLVEGCRERPPLAHRARLNRDKDKEGKPT